MNIDSEKRKNVPDSDLNELKKRVELLEHRLKELREDNALMHADDRQRLSEIEERVSPSDSLDSRNARHEGVVGEKERERWTPLEKYTLFTQEERDELGSVERRALAIFENFRNWSEPMPSGHGISTQNNLIQLLETATGEDLQPRQTHEAMKRVVELTKKPEAKDENRISPFSFRDGSYKAKVLVLEEPGEIRLP